MIPKSLKLNALDAMMAKNPSKSSTDTVEKPATDTTDAPDVTKDEGATVTCPCCGGEGKVTQEEADEYEKAMPNDAAEEAAEGE